MEPMRLRQITITGAGKPLARISLDRTGRIWNIEHLLGGTDEQEALVLVEAEEHLRRSHGLAVVSAADGIRSMLPQVAAGMSTAVFARVLCATIGQLGDNLPDDVVIEIGDWPGGGT